MIDLAQGRVALAQFLGVDHLNQPIYLDVNGEPTPFKFDVRMDCYAKLLMVNPKTLGENGPADIYVLGHLEDFDSGDVSLLGWQFWKIISQEWITSGGLGRVGHCVPITRLREMRELKDKLVGV